MFYVPKKAFDLLKKKLEKGQVTGKDVDALVNWEPKKGEMYLPVDMNGAGENLDDFELALDKFGAKTCAECFMKAFKYYEDTKSKLPEDKREKPLTADEWKEKFGEEDEDDGDDDEVIKPRYIPDMFYVPQKAFSLIKRKLSNKETISVAEVDALVNWEPQSDEMYLPLDMNGADEDLDDFEDALAKLGAQTVAQSFVQAADFFEKNKSKLPQERQKPLTAKEWKDQHHEDDEEENDDAAFDEEEESEDDDEGDGEEPPAKKSRKD